MNILITGGTGFIGIAITEKFLDEGCRVVVFDRKALPAGIMPLFKTKRGEFIFIKGDVLDSKQVGSAIKSNNIDMVIHAAAITPDRDREINNGRSIIDVNCGGLINVMEAAQQFGSEKCIYLSSGAVYGKGQWQLPELSEENTPADPETYYEVTKFASERIAMRYQQLSGLDTLILRLGDVFGAWEHYSGARDVMSAPFQVIRLAMVGQKAFLPRAGLKNWIYSRDIASCIFDSLYAPVLRHNIYHLSAPYRWSVEQWCQLLADKYPNFSYEITTDERLVNVVFRPDHAPMSIRRMMQDIKTTLQFDLRESFNDYTKWAEAHASLLDL